MRLLNLFRLHFDRSFSGKFWKQITFLIILAIVVILILWFVFYLFFPFTMGKSLVKAVGYLFDSNAFYHDSKDYLEGNYIPPLLSAFITFIGMVLMSGILVSFITNRLERRVDRIKGGSVYYPFKDHIVILGYDETTPSLIKQIYKQNDSCNIILQTSLNAEEVRRKLHAQLNDREENRIVIIHSKRDSLEDLNKIYIHKARRVYLLGEADEFDHDALNINCLLLIAKIRKSKGCTDRLICVTSLRYQSTFTLFQSTDISKEIKEYIEFQPFNFCEVWARKVLVSGESIENGVRYKPLDYQPITEDSEKTVHLVVAGMTNMGVSLAMKAAHIAHFPNFVRDKSKKTKITLIDIDAKREMHYLIGRYKQLFPFCKYTFTDYTSTDGKVQLLNDPQGDDDFLDIEWEFIQGNISDLDIQSKIRDWSDEQNKTLMTIAVCFDNPTKNIATGLYFYNEIYERSVPVLIYQKTSGELFSMLSDSKYKNVRPFGMNNDGYDTAIFNFDWAKRVNYIYDYFDSNKTLPDSYPTDLLNRKWNKLTVAKQWSNIYNASTIPIKLRSIGIDYKNIPADRELSDYEIAMLAEVEHNRWNVEELLLGFRPATKEEKALIKAQVDTLKDDYRARFIHYDIRPYKDLQVDKSGENANRYDIIITKGLLSIFRQ